MVVEVLRVDELASGIAATATDGEALPLARGSRIAVAGRAWVVQSPGGDPIRDTGDVRRVEPIASGGDAVRDAVSHDQAVHSAARRLGEGLAQRVLGEPIATAEEL
jgi:hypothetical protein